MSDLRPCVCGPRAPCPPDCPNRAGVEREKSERNRRAALAADGWRESRDAIVRAAVTRLAGAPSSDFLAMQSALAAAFEEAARQEAERFGTGAGWAVLSQAAVRLSAP